MQTNKYLDGFVKEGIESISTRTLWSGKEREWCLVSFLAGILAGACHREEGIESHYLHRGGIRTPNGVLSTELNSKAG